MTSSNVETGIRCSLEVAAGVVRHNAGVNEAIKTWLAGRDQVVGVATAPVSWVLDQGDPDALAAGQLSLLGQQVGAVPDLLGQGSLGPPVQSLVEGQGRAGPGQLEQPAGPHCSACGHLRHLLLACACLSLRSSVAEDYGFVGSPGRFASHSGRAHDGNVRFGQQWPLFRARTLPKASRQLNNKVAQPLVST